MPNSLFKVRAVHQYASDEVDDLTFGVGQVINVEVVEDAEWYSGNYTDSNTGQFKTGLFPQSFVQKIPNEPPRPSHASHAKFQQQTDLSASPINVPAVPAAKEAAPIEAASPIRAPVPVSSNFAPIQKQSSASPEMKSSASASSFPLSAPPSSASNPTSSSSAGPPKKRNAFQDRIAAFNSSSDATAFSPLSQPKQGTYSKKPFHAAPTNSYVPHIVSAPKPVRSPPPQGSEVVHYNDHQESEEEQSMPNVSLKDRIKLLQQQQAAEAARAEALATKKMKKAKQRQEGAEQLESAETGGSLKSLTRRDSSEFQGELDASHTGGSVGQSIDGDSHALSSVHESQEPSVTGRQSLDHARIETVVEREEAEEGDEDEDEDEDEEEAKRLALRERMAKISGGMGMHMMMPGMMPGSFSGMPGTAPPLKKSIKKVVEDVEPVEHKSAPVPSDLEEDEEDESLPPARSLPPPQPTRLLPPQPPLATGLAPGFTQPPVNRELVSVINAHKDESESEDAEEAWSESETSLQPTKPAAGISATAAKRNSTQGIIKIF